MGIPFQIGFDAITSYKRLAYTPWHAIAEFVDNSTQSYFNNRDLLDKVAIPEQKPLIVRIDYSLDEGVLRIEDNAMGMSYQELENALYVAHPPKITSGRSKYGMGLKTAACWIGNLWSIRTKKLGETEEHMVTIDVQKIAEGHNDLPYVSKSGCSKDDHYTVVEIKHHNQKFQGRTLGKIGQFLSSMYREDFRNDILTLKWRDKILDWVELDDKLLTSRDGSKYQKPFDFYINEDDEEKKRVYGWVGILQNGSRSNAGFSILHSGRVVKGWPDSWRPSSLYGQDQGSNDLVNQRLVGEIHLDEFDVSHTKDDILWLGDQLDQVEDGLLKHCGDYKQAARDYRKSKDDRRGPSEIETNAAINEFQKELESPEMVDIIALDPMLPRSLVEEVVRSVKDSVVEKYEARFDAKIDQLTVKLYVEDDISSLEPYVTIDSTQDTEVVIIVNAAHPHWNQLSGAQGVLNYLRHCTYDGISEWQARKKVARLDPETIKLLKDKLLRLPLEIEQHIDDEDS